MAGARAKLTKAFLIFLAALAVYSFVPVVGLYLSKDPSPTSNERAIARIDGNKGEHFRFVVLGDNHAGLVFDDSAFLKEIRHINREERFKKFPVDFVAISGDLTYRGSPWDYRIFNRLRALIKKPVICAIGNHDRDDNRGRHTYFSRLVGKADFSFVDRNSYFIVIDNEVGELSNERFTWLEDELKKSQGRAHRFVILHKPPAAPYQESWYRPEVNTWGYRFMKLCEANKVDIVFSGHEHMYKEMQFGGVKYVVSGGGGIITHIPRNDGGFIHYLVVRVNGDYVDYEVRRITPPFWEFLTYYLWKDLFYFMRDIIF